MANEVKGITIDIEANTAKFDDSIGDVEKKIKSLKSTQEQLRNKLKQYPNDVNLINESHRVLNQLLENSRIKMQKYEEQIIKSKSNIEKYKKQQEEIAKASGSATEKTEEEKKQIAQLQAQIDEENLTLTNLVKTYNSTAKAVSSYTKQLENYEAKHFSKIFKDNEEKLRAVGDAFVYLGNQAKVASGLASAGLIAMTKEAGDFQQQWVAVQKVLKAQDLSEGSMNTKSWDTILDEIKSMASTLPVSIDTIMQTFANSAQLGIANDNLQEFVETMLRLDSATNITADDASMRIAQLYNIMGADIKNVDNFANALVRLGNTSATTERDILEMASTLAGSATNVGFTEYQVLALADALASMGLASASAGSSISTILTNIDKAVAKTNKDLQKNRKATNDWAKLLGVTGKQFSRMWSQDASATFVKIIGALNAGRDAGKNLNLALADLGISSIRQDRSVKALVNSYDLLKKQMIESKDAFYNGTDAIDESDRAWSTFNSSVASLKNNLQLLAVEFGDQLLPIVQPFVEKLTELVQALMNLDDNTKNFILKIMAIVAVVAPLLLTIGGLMLAFAGLNGALKKLALVYAPLFKTIATGITALKGMFVGIISPLGVVIVAILALVAGFIYAWNNIDGFKESMLGVWRTIKEMFIPIIDAVIFIIGQLWEWIKIHIIPIFKNLGEIIASLWVIFGDLLSIIASLITWVFENFPAFWEFFQETFGWIIDLVSLTIDIFNSLLGVLKDVIGWASKTIDKLLEAVGLKKKVEWDGSHTGSSSGLKNVLQDSDFGSGGLGINTSGLSFASGGIGAINLQTSINVNNNGTPINDSMVRNWANTITDIVSENIGRRL